MESVAIKADIREQVRTKGASATRAEGKIPCILYGGDEVTAVAVEFNELRHVIYTPEFKLCELDVNGEKVQCIVKEVQFHPVTEEVVHVDFLRLIPGREIKVEVPIQLVGQAPGLRAGGKLIRKMRRVKIKATPENLVDHMTLDISKLKLGFSVRVKDFQEEEGVEVLNHSATPVASIVVPRALKAVGADGEEEEEEEEGQEGAEGEGAAEEAAE